MEKYNKIVECFNTCYWNCVAVTEKWQKELDKIKENAYKEAQESCKLMCDTLETTVKDWTSEDYDTFIQMAVNDKRLDSTGILTISTAYARTHEDDAARIKNLVCRDVVGYDRGYHENGC